MQRPEVTRQQPSEPPDEKYIKEVKAEKARMQAESARSEGTPSRKTQKAIDSARKAYAPIAKPTSPRRVKTYTERLQELKPTRRYATPIVPRQHMPDSVSARSARSTLMSQRRPVGPPHKPMTYVEQLKKINAAAATTAKKTARGPSSLSSARSRPYGDPYAVASEDALSVISDWSMDDDVRKLIYDDQESTVGYTANGTEASYTIDHFVAPSEAGASDYYDVIMGEGDPDLGFDYRDSVDVSELERIAEGASVGSGSVLSVIDWDAVDKLIEDV
nr:hypothetical protein BaRGS_028340 [Batillaria attramentaria]